MSKMTDEEIFDLLFTIDERLSNLISLTKPLMYCTDFNNFSLIDTSSFGAVLNREI